MAFEHIIAILTAERDKLHKAIEALMGSAKRRGRPPKNPLAAAAAPVKAVKAAPAKRKGRTFTAAQKKAAAERMRQRWAAKKTAQ
jgi:hypothetical protein